jgi:general secretion pathway protein G
MRTEPAITRSGHHADPRGFSLMEILIVVVILGILAAIAVPKLSNASHVARESTLKDDLRFLRTQITVYHSQHHDVSPGYPGGDVTQTATETDLVAQLTQFTDDQGHVSASASAAYRWGPYLTQMPDNPLNSLHSIKILGAPDTFTADGSTGWLYQPSSGLIMPNLTGSDSSGKDYSTY